MDTTIDGILGQRVQLEQPAKGFRIAIDTVFLASAVPAKPGEKILDLGCGVGGAMLCLAARVPEIEVLGVDIQHELVDLCRKNISRNNMKQMKVICDDVTNLSLLCFDHVMMNPPYHDEMRHDASDNQQRRIANTEKDGDLGLWLKNGANALADAGVLTLIHRADRLDEITATAAKYFGTMDVMPMLPKVGVPPKRVIVRLNKKTTGVNYCSPIILYRPGGGYTEEAENILRHAKELEFV